jgi:hypothetical protein
LSGRIAHKPHEEHDQRSRLAADLSAGAPLFDRLRAHIGKEEVGLIPLVEKLEDREVEARS